MLCPTCGQDTLEGAFCIHCGASVAPNSPEEPANPLEEAPGLPEQDFYEYNPPAEEDVPQSPPETPRTVPDAPPAYTGYTPPREPAPAYAPPRYPSFAAPEPDTARDAHRPAGDSPEETVRPKLTVQEAPRPLSVKRFFWIELVSWIPVLNIIVLCCIALSSRGNPNAVRLAQAKLTVMMLLLTLLLAGAAVVMLLIAGDVIDGVYLGRWKLG